MQRVRQFSFSFFFCQLVLCITNASVHADWPKPIIPSGTGPVLAPIGGSSAGTKQGTISAPNLTSPAYTDAHQTLLPGLLEQIYAHKVSVQQAWDDKLITVDGLLWLFNSYIGPWGNLGNEKNLDVRHALVALLVEHGGKKLAEPQMLPPKVRLWLADYYGSIGNEKCVALSESILNEIKVPVKGEDALVFQAIERIAWYYSYTGDHEKSAQTWERVMAMHATSGWWVGDAKVLAGLQYLSTTSEDNQRRAQSLLTELLQGDQEISEFGLQGLQTAITKWLKAGKTHVALSFLQQLTPIAKKTPVAQLVVEDGLGNCFWHDGDLVKAREHFFQAVALDAAANTTSSIAGVNALSDAQSKLQKIDNWQESIIVSDIPQIDLVVNQGQPQNLCQMMRLESSESLPVIVSCDNPQVRARIGSEWKKGADGITHERRIDIEIPASALQESFDAILMLRCAKYPEWKLSVPISVDVRHSIPVIKADGDDQLEWVQ